MNAERLAWRTSSFSGTGQDSNCVEVAPAWRTSSFTGDGQNASTCVEVAPLPLGIAVRDTKDRTLPPHTYSAPAWQAFVDAVRAGEFEA